MSLAAIPAVTGAIGLFSQIKGQQSAESRANRAEKSQSALTAEQLEQIRALKPFLAALQSGAMGQIGPLIANAMKFDKDARQFDPGAETERIMGESDALQRDSLSRDLNSAHVPLSMRGLSGSSESNAAAKDVIGRRARDRSSLLTSLRLGEGDRKAAFQGRASDALSRVFSLLNPVGASSAITGQLGSVAGQYGAMADRHSQTASQFDPSGAMGMLSSGLQSWIGTGGPKAPKVPTAGKSTSRFSLGSGSYMIHTPTRSIDPGDMSPAEKLRQWKYTQRNGSGSPINLRSFRFAS